MVEVTEHLNNSSGKVIGHNEAIDGYWCFVGDIRGKKVIYTRQPMNEHNAELEQARNQLELLRAYGRNKIDFDTFIALSSNQQT